MAAHLRCLDIVIASDGSDGSDDFGVLLLGRWFNRIVFV
jgi:hypothetical protein